MRILLASNAVYAPPRGGSTRSNLAWLRALASRGHSCTVVSPAPESQSADDPVDDGGVRILRFRRLAQRPQVLTSEIESFQPDWVLVSSEDLSHVLLAQARQAAPERLVYLAHTPQFFPFGPESWNADRPAADAVRSARAVVAIGRHMAGYIERHAGVRAAVVHPPIYAAPPYPLYGRFGEGSMLMINPCEVKGIRIFEDLARRCPEFRFEALTGWGTTRADRARLAELPNVTLLEPVKDIGEALSRASLLLMPSLWYEGFGLIAMEAMLGGLPVVASDSGGLLEAKEGTGYVIPVRPVRGYQDVFDENHMPRPIVPEQDIAPWERAIRRLMTDRAEYERESEASRRASAAFVSRVKPGDFEDLLLSLEPALVPGAKPKPADLTPAQRALLLERLKRRRS